MCDYSLMHLKSRPAKVGDKMLVKDFGTGTVGFCDPFVSENVAVCLKPGTEIAFERPFETREWDGMWSHKKYTKVVIFRQVDKNKDLTHHDALETPDGQIVKLTNLRAGQWATVLQLPAEPKTAEEAKEQERLAVVG